MEVLLFIQQLLKETRNWKFIRKWANLPINEHLCLRDTGNHLTEVWTMYALCFPSSFFFLLISVIFPSNKPIWKSKAPLKVKSYLLSSVILFWLCSNIIFNVYVLIRSMSAILLILICIFFPFFLEEIDLLKGGIWLLFEGNE